MAVVNVPANSGVQFPPNVVPGLMNVYCVGPGQATFEISIMNPPPPMTQHVVNQGHMVTFQVDNFAVWVVNHGPSRIQLLYGAAVEGQSVEETEHALALAVS